MYPLVLFVRQRHFQEGSQHKISINYIIKGKSEKDQI